MSTELHLFILWQKVGRSRDALLRRLREEFTVLRVFQVRWSPSLFSANLTRFYGQALPPGCRKEEDCGSGPFTLVVVRDDRPAHDLRDTTRGRRRVNTRTFDLKSRFRATDGGGLPVHATDTVQETAHDLTLLLGEPADRFTARHPGEWSGEIEPLRRDLAGARGWRSMDELFAVLEQTLEYLILRNFEGLPEQYTLEGHGDIDLLVADFRDACLVTNATPVFSTPRRVHQHVMVGGSAVPFDFRHVGDGYYDAAWQRHMLLTRTRTPSGCRVPDVENHFYGLLYHAAVHKPAIGADYVARLEQLAATAGVPTGGTRLYDNPRALRRFLLTWMRPRGYRFTLPQDPSVHFNSDVAGTPLGRIAARLLPLRAAGRAAVSDPADIGADAQANSARALLMSRLRACEDLSSHSAEVAALIEDADTELLLGSGRANVLDVIPVHAGTRVLELGCQAGAVTRALGERGARVTALEESATLAALAAERCRDLPDVEVRNDDPVGAHLDGPFDVVTLVGLPARSLLDNEAGHPWRDAVERAAGVLDEDGLLLLAVDNQLGLRFFNGCREPQSGLPYFGINDLLPPAQQATLGREALRRLLDDAGLVIHRWFYPFPDFRLPALLLEHHAATHPGLRLADLLLHHPGRDYPDTPARAFSDVLAWRPVVDNGLLPGLANAFLVVAGRGTRDSQAPWLARMFSRGRRRPAYQVVTTIEPVEQTRLVVRKRRALSSAAAEPGWLTQRIDDSDYVHGELLLTRIHRAMALEAEADDLADAFAPWLQLLGRSARRDGDGTQVLPADFIDCIPANLIVLPDGVLHYFDAEWVADRPPPLAWIVVRGIILSLADCLENGTLRPMTLRELIGHVAARSGVQLEAADFARAEHLEVRLMNHCNAGVTRERVFADLYDKEPPTRIRLSDRRRQLDELINAQTFEIDRVKSSVSWRVTGPLRAAWNLARKLPGLGP